MTNTASRSRIIARLGSLILATVLGLTLAAQPAFAQRGNGRMQGKIVAADGTGLEEVEIVAFNPDVSPDTLTGTSGNGGRWSMLGFARGNWKFTFKKQGYISYEITVTVSAANRNPDLDVTLNPIPEDAGATGVGSDAASPALFTEGTALYDAGDYAGAIAKWTEFLTLNPTLHQVQGNLGNAYRQAGDIDKARAAYQALLAVEPANTMANYNLGEMLVEAGEIEEAMPYFEKVLETAPDDPAVYYNVAELYASERQTDTAVQYYKRAIEVDPTYLPAYKQMGFALVATDKAGAIAAFEKYIELAPPDDPDLQVVKDVLAYLKSG